MLIGIPPRCFGWNQELSDLQTLDFGLSDAQVA